MGPNINYYFQVNDISTDPVKMLWYFCLHPAFNSKWTSFYIFINVALCFVFTGLAIKGILLSYNNDIFYMTENLQTCILMAHIIGNVSSLHANRRGVLSLLQQKSKFWKITNFEKESLYEDSLKKIKFVKRIIRSYFLFSVFTAISFDLQPFTTGLLPTVCYVPEGWFSYLTIVLWYLSYVTLISLVGTACLFCSLVTSLVEQFQLLAHKLRNMCNKKLENVGMELEILVNHHNFLISYCEELNATFSSIFLLDFIISIASASVAVFIFMQPGDWTNRIKCVTYFLVIILEIGFYCIPLEIVRNTALEIDNVLYDSKWYEIEMTSFKKCIILIMSRSQKPILFSGYGLININLNTYVLICKTVFSYYMYLNSVKKLSMK